MTALAIPQPRGASSQATSIEQSRAVAEVQAAIYVAQSFPRNLDRALGEMRDACGRKALADRAFYQVRNRGTGPSIHLAKELARIWGNIDYGVRELHRDDVSGESEILAFAWDQQTNSRQSRTFIVPHERMKDGKRQPLTDLQDVYLNNQNIGARALRECIMTLLPTYYTEEAQGLCRKTIEQGDGTPIAQRIEAAVAAYGGLGVKPAQLEARLGKKRSQWDAGDVATLQVLYTSIQRGETRVDDEFIAEAPTVSSIVNGEKATEALKDEQPPVAPTDPATDDAATETPGGEVPPADVPSDAAEADRSSSPGPDAITRPQRDKIFAAFKDAGIANDPRSAEGKKSRLDYIHQAIGHPVTSTNDLTKIEAGVVIEMLEKDAAELREQPAADGALFNDGGQS